MRIQENDWLVVQHENRARLVLFDSNNYTLKDRIGVRVGDLHENIHVNEEDVMANLGKTPRFESGKVFGADVLPVFRSDTVAGLGDVHFMRKFKNKEERKSLIKAGETLVGDLVNRGVLPQKQIVCFIVPPKKSKLYLGSYRHFDSLEKVDELTLFADDYNDKKQSQYVWAHELCHGIWFTRMTADMRSDWIESYNANVSTFKFGDNTLKTLLDGLTNAGKVHIYRKSVDTDEREVLDECLKYMRRVHSIDNYHISDLLNSGRSLKKFWPTDPIQLSRKDTVVSEYATVSPDEFFADTMAYYLLGTEIPKTLRVLCKQTLKQAVHVEYETPKPKKSKDG